ncbi:MAG: hypothetical protein B5M56_07105 [Desulfococcus sp. 4484_241]|nr:MAG: hypothetical protein B5M56_07105 [Desulfococcus sp. 4484_241]
MALAAGKYGLLLLRITGVCPFAGMWQKLLPDFVCAMAFQTAAEGSPVAPAPCFCTREKKIS